VQEYYKSRLCHWVKFQSVSNATKKFISLRIQLSMAADVEWSIHLNEHQWSVNDLGSCDFGN
jgi:hypothetical protein